MVQKNPSKFYKELFDLQGKVAVVIGGTGLLCGEMAWGLLQAGCRVVLVGRNKKKLMFIFNSGKVLRKTLVFLKLM